MARLLNRLSALRAQQYDRLPVDEGEPSSPSKSRKRSRQSFWKWVAAVSSVVGLAVFYLVIRKAVQTDVESHNSCDTIDDGYRCSPSTSHFWGQYSLWFSVPSDVETVPPKGCSVSFASVLSRHGGRDPTLGKSLAYALLIEEIHNNSNAYPDEFAFLKDYKYTLGADQLTDAGRQEMVNSGAHFYRRYSTLVADTPPFVRSGGQARVVESANKWLKGFAEAGKHSAPAPIDVTIPEGPGYNNTLSHKICTAYEEGRFKEIGADAQRKWATKFIPPIQSRVNSKLGTNLSETSIIYLMDMCPFDTLASPTASVSKFCNLFTEDEWHQYDYYQTLGKYYGFGNGNPLGPTQGVGYVNELIARLTETPVNDHTNTNRTLDSNPVTFPLDRKVYADFSHDNDMTRIFAAMGLYNTTRPLSNSTIEGTNVTNGYSAAWTVPFAARMYVEKLRCEGEEEEFVRVIVNDRVMPLEFCEADDFGRCKLSKFVESQSFARSGGHWDECFSQPAQSQKREI
ncbi:phosphoglycerate mutase-like protein [Westerdykella ornata]|uniref:Phytase A n=1 Tax=Westerdykella ornata TaxID=318751 RepID=A0A6A6J4X2_WESOR|nr:phosphoglycerate mutase-like protein [Westerdykella ornata]KAF2271621.1 phosphoglycerate mutase-like protein [Westerdykella ornata]